MNNLTKKIIEFFDKSSIKYHIKYQNYKIAEELAKSTNQQKYILSLYQKNDLNLLSLNFYNHSD